MSLTLHLRGGRSQKLLWLRSEHVPPELLDEWVRSGRTEYVIGVNALLDGERYSRRTRVHRLLTPIRSPDERS